MGCFEHFVLTRFSVKTTWGFDDFPDEWLAERLELFEKYCLPGIAAQTRADFRWLVFCDKSTPKWCIARLREHAKHVPQLEIATTARRRKPMHLVRDRVGDATDVLVTTRLDSDDALHTGFVETAAEYEGPFRASSHDAWLLSFCRGFKLDVDADRLFSTHHLHSPFLTLFERVDEARDFSTVNVGKHGHLHERWPIHQDASLVGWMQVIHGGNVSNRVVPSDIEVPRSEADDGFVIGRPRRRTET